MPFIRNAWYCVGYPEEVGDEKTKALTVLGEPLLFFRGQDGAVKALLDRCPHRFAPLSMGKVIGGEVQCAYHGLRFDGTGRCTVNPHGDQAIPRAAQVRSYPVLERYGIVWVWMGEADKADPAVLPDFQVIEERADRARVQGYLKTPANYALIIDNLLDLTHARYLHPLLTGTQGQRVEPARIDLRLEQNGESIVSVNESFAEGPSPLAQLMWEPGGAPALIDVRSNMRWDAPALMLLDSGFVKAGGAWSEGPSFPSAHLLTPETETTTHYFWIVNRDTHIHRPEVSQQIAGVAMATFGNEDSPMLLACQRNMGTTDLMSLRPVLLQTDAPAIRARRLLTARLEADAQVGQQRRSD